MILALHKIDAYIKKLLVALLFFLPWQTVWVYGEMFLNGDKWQYGTLGWYATELLLWGAIALFVYRAATEIMSHAPGSVQLTSDRLFAGACALFLVYAFASSFWSFVPELARQQSLRMTGAFLFFFLLLIYRQHLRMFLWSFVIGSIPVSILGIWQFLSQTSVASSAFGLSQHPAWQAGTSVVFSDSLGRWLRAYGSFPHPNFFGGYLAVVLGAILFLFLFKKISTHDRTSLVITSMLTTAALFFSFSRSAWFSAVCLIVGAGIILKKLGRPISLPVALAVQIAILVIIFFPLVSLRSATVITPSSASVSERITGSEEAMGLIAHAPLYGYGAGNYTAAAYQADTTRHGWEYQPVHQVPLLLVTELGAVGMVWYAFILISYIRLIPLQSLTKERKLAIAIAALSGMPLVLLDHYLYTSYTGLLLSGCAAALVLFVASVEQRTHS